eukprot:COSAG01_NODE_13399_length_1591_cov_1.282842_1_plen_109_part_10
MKRPHASAAAAALIAAGAGPPSEQSEPLTTEPGVPAPTQGATQTSVESSSIALTWGAPEDHGAPIENYIVEQVRGALSLPSPPPPPPPPPQPQSPYSFQNLHKIYKKKK